MPDGASFKDPRLGKRLANDGRSISPVRAIRADHDFGAMDLRVERFTLHSALAPNQIRWHCYRQVSGKLTPKMPRTYRRIRKGVSEAKN